MKGSNRDMKPLMDEELECKIQNLNYHHESVFNPQERRYMNLIMELARLEPYWSKSGESHPGMCVNVFKSNRRFSPTKWDSLFIKPK